MLYLIGAGLHPNHLTQEAVKAIGECKTVYLESYTNHSNQDTLQALETIAEKKIVSLSRKQVEEEFLSILEEAKKEDIAVLVIGNALTATTHIQILLDSKKKGVSYKIIPGISITNFLGETGLEAYKFGKITSIVSPKQGYAPSSFFDVIEKNKNAGYHSLCLLDIDAEKEYMMSVKEAIELLEKIEKEKGKKIIENSVLIGLYGMGSDQQTIVTGTAEKLKQFHPSVFPQSLIVCAELNDKEQEAVRVLNND